MSSESYFSDKNISLIKVTKSCCLDQSSTDTVYTWTSKVFVVSVCVSKFALKHWWTLMKRACYGKLTFISQNVVTVLHCSHCWIRWIFAGRGEVESRLSGERKSLSGGEIWERSWSILTSAKHYLSIICTPDRCWQIVTTESMTTSLVIWPATTKYQWLKVGNWKACQMAFVLLSRNVAWCFIYVVT